MGSPAWKLLRNIEEHLWIALLKQQPAYKRSALDGWFMCPRSVASRSKGPYRYAVELAACPGMPQVLGRVRETFEEFGRLHDGDDLVFAIADLY